MWPGLELWGFCRVRLFHCLEGLEGTAPEPRLTFTMGDPKVLSVCVPSPSQECPGGKQLDGASQDTLSVVWQGPMSRVLFEKRLRFCRPEFTDSGMPGS